MKYYILIIVIILIMGTLNANTDFVGTFTTRNPSSTIIALGYESGAAYIWNNNPLNSWSNPALLAYCKGLSWVSSSEMYYSDFPIYPYMYSSYISYANDYFTLLVPMVNASYKFGTTYKYNSSPYYYNDDESDSYKETCSRFSVACKLSKIIFQKIAPTINDKFEISVGYDLKYVTSNVPPIILEEADASGYMHGVGVVGLMKPLRIITRKVSRFDLDITGGIYMMNVTKNNVSNDTYAYSLPYGTRMGFASKLSYMPFNENAVNYLSPFKIKGTFSISYIYGNSKYADDPSSWGHGIEVGLFNTLFLRRGFYKNNTHKYSGHTFGLGVGVHLMRYFYFEYNYTEYPDGTDANARKNDFTVSVDIMNLFTKK